MNWKDYGALVLLLMPPAIIFTLLENLWGQNDWRVAAITISVLFIEWGVLGIVNRTLKTRLLSRKERNGF